MSNCTHKYEKRKETHINVMHSHSHETWECHVCTAVLTYFNKLNKIYCYTHNRTLAFVLRSVLAI